jgi:F-type H+-transporting ATPase subunit b
MHIDYPVVLTTIIGFVIVVLVLRKLAWGPILELLDQRRDKIKSDFANASQARTDAESMRGDLEVKLGDIKSIERERVQEAVKKGEALAGKLRQEAQVKADSSLDKARHDIEVETQKAQIQLRDQVVDLAIKSSEILLKQKLDDATHRKLIQDYIDGLEETPNA